MNVRTLQQLMTDNLIVKHFAGSHAYGTNLPSSDVDYRGIFCADPVHIRTPFFKVYEATDTTEEDTKFYELSNFMKLAVDCNPNIIETLWVDESDIVHTSSAYKILCAHREKLLSKKVAFTFSGYAMAQLKRIKGHNKWINQPQPEESPKPYQFLTVVQWFGEDKNLHPVLDWYVDNYRFIPYGDNLYGVYPAIGHHLWDQHGNLNTKFEESREDFRNPLMFVKWNKEEYVSAKEKHNQYWTWKKNRNIARSELEEQFGYDTKHAMHLVRLMRMGVEILRDHVVNVKRSDAEELLAIRGGAWPYEEVIKYAEDMDKQVREYWYEHSTLPKTPDINFAAHLTLSIQNVVWDTADNEE